MFSDKKGINAIYKALSSHFDKTLFFGIIRSSESALVNKYKVKEFPTILLVKNSETKPEKYTGEMSYAEIFNFINVYSETFVFHGDNP